MAVTNGGGWAGKMLRVDLTTRTITTQDTFPTYEQYWGGAGIRHAGSFGTKSRRAPIRTRPTTSSSSTPAS